MSMDSLINSIISAIERLLTVVHSTRRLLFLVCLTLMLICCFLIYQLTRSQEVIGELISPRIERVGDWCYQQRVRLDSRIVAIQFPIPDYLIKLGVEQNVSALVVRKNLNPQEFSQLCKGLVDEILDPGVELRLLQSNPQWKQRLQEFYKDLDKPVHLQAPPLKESEIKK
jgi:hypothetical protein